MAKSWGRREQSEQEGHAPSPRTFAQTARATSSRSAAIERHALVLASSRSSSGGNIEFSPTIARAVSRACVGNELHVRGCSLDASSPCALRGTYQRVASATPSAEIRHKRLLAPGGAPANPR